MRTIRYFILVIATIGLLGIYACEADSEAQQAGEELEQASEEMGDALRKEQEKLEEDLVEARQDIDRRLENLNRELEDASGEARTEIQREIDQLQTWDEELEQKLAAIDNTMKEGWSNLKKDVRNTVQEIEREMESNDR